VTATGMKTELGHEMIQSDETLTPYKSDYPLLEAIIHQFS
jgi:hypothetical protein